MGNSVDCEHAHMPDFAQCGKKPGKMPVYLGQLNYFENRVNSKYALALLCWGHFCLLVPKH